MVFEKISEKNLLKISDKKMFDQFLSGSPQKLSPYNFANIYIWNSLFEISWYLIHECVCVFFNNNGGCFMYLSPLGIEVSDKVVEKCFQIMDGCNDNKQLSRIENVPEEQLSFYKGMGFDQTSKSSDYQYIRNKIVELKGDAYKSKRAGCNYFTKNNRFIYKPYSLRYEQECILLLKCWIANRKENNSDDFYGYMLDDILPVQQNAIKNFFELGLIGRVVMVEGKVAGYTFGYELNSDTFCIMFEVVNNQYKGISQFIFREFAWEMDGYKYINTMDDSGLINLTRVKKSYRPCELISNSIVRRMQF